MKITILTTFPEMFTPLHTSMLGRAEKAGLLDIREVDIRPYSKNKHHNTDDAPFGGGAGMVMLAQPIVDAVRDVQGPDFHGRRIYLSPRGATLTQKKAEELAKEEELILLCGHYEGVDQRALDLCMDEELSIGDYILTGGELGAMVLVDCVARLIPGVLGCGESAVTESFSSGLLEYPQYTRPREFEGLTVPEPLLNGNHREIEAWQTEESLYITGMRRPEMLEAWLKGKKFSRAHKRVVDAALLRVKEGREALAEAERVRLEEERLAAEQALRIAEEARQAEEAFAELRQEEAFPETPPQKEQTALSSENAGQNAAASGNTQGSLLQADEDQPDEGQSGTTDAAEEICLPVR